MKEKELILSARGIEKVFYQRDFWGRKKIATHAVQGGDLDLYKGECYGLVGESGCGKSTLGRCLLGLQERTAGEVYFHGQEIKRKDSKALREMQDKMQIIFQDPYSSLNPHWTVEEILREPLRRLKLSRTEEEAKIKKALERVFLAEADRRKMPYAFSGGQRQRIGIARALIVEPEIILCDEPISALDVSIQAQIVNLLKDLQKELGLSYIFTAHDLAMVRYISDRIGVMQAGKIVEEGDCESIFQNPQKEYTRTLLSAVPGWCRKEG
nr:ATP-binding cassette domain-containing protein [uncultured Oribacterium sp.]